jgi:cadherin-like protein/Big-like domain-containing protein
MSISEALIQEALDASNAVYSAQAAVDASNAANVVPGGPDLYELLDSPLLDSFNIQQEANGFFAQAYVDLTNDNVIIAYEGSTPSFASVVNEIIGQNQSYATQSTAADQALLLGLTPNALNDAVAFARYASAVAKDQGYGNDPVYVTGHSLGGTEAEAAAHALNTSVSGGFISGAVTFGATGLPDYLSTGGNNNFLNFVDYGDPVGNYADDSLSELKSLAQFSGLGSHFGTVELVGSKADPKFIIGAALATSEGQFKSSFQYHFLQNYANDLGDIYGSQFDTDINPLPIDPNTLLDSFTPTPDINLAYILAQQSASLSSTSTSSSPYPVVNNPSTNPNPVDTNSFTQLTQWFSASEANNSGGSHHVAEYSLFVVSGSGTLVVDGLPYALGQIAENISQAEFDTAWFEAGPNSGATEVAVIAIDDLGQPSIAGDMTIAVTAPAAAPQPVIPTDHTPPTIVPGQTLLIQSGQEKSVTTGNLLATDSNSANFTPSQLEYVITSGPSDGNLVNTTGSIVASFNQQDVDNGLIEYISNGASASSDQFSYRVVDPAGNSSSGTLSIEIQPPAGSVTQTPYVTAELADDTGIPEYAGFPAFSTSDMELIGTANPGATVELTDGSTPLGSAVVDSSGYWSFSPPNNFAQGSHGIAASVTLSGQTATYYLNFAYDTVAPPAPSTTVAFYIDV